jgi:hypothetical protein
MTPSTPLDGIDFAKWIDDVGDCGDPSEVLCLHNHVAVTPITNGPAVRNVAGPVNSTAVFPKETPR